MDTAPPKRLRSLLWGDVQRAAVVAAFGCAFLVVTEYIATVRGYPLDIRAATHLRLVLLDITLCGFFWVIATALLSSASLAARVVLALDRRERALEWPGFYTPFRVHEQPRPGIAWLWASVFSAALYILLSSRLSWWAMNRFQEPQITAILLAVMQVVLIAHVAAIGYAVGRVTKALGRRLDARLGQYNPFGHALPAAGLMVVLGYTLLRVLVVIMPHLDPLVPWRHLQALLVVSAGAWFGTWFLARRGHLLPTGKRNRWIAIGSTVLASAIIVPYTLLSAGADAETKYVAITASPTLSTMIDTIRRANDFDGDGFGSLLGENDCAPFNKKIHPGARDIPDNGIDENCDGRDFSFATPPSYRVGEKLPVPKEWARNNWNILLLTIDTVRYDHTGFGGYIKKRGRDTTPNLDELVKKSASFSFANAPSAGTMASIPAILTSKFFHSGIALDEKNIKRGMPPRLAPANVLISEILKRRGYTTGAILTHPYFNDWGMKQGFDTYDNDLGAKRDPRKVTSHAVTDRAVAWVARNNRKKWFLWAHYIDPHGRYVAHPDKSFGSSEEDLYDGELYYTDKHVGRLLKELARIPGAERTIIVITSDHGDAFNEHGFINHGQALYRELLHVPLIFYIPNLPPRVIPGAVSPLDIVPTVADLAGVNVSNMSFEGESLVPQLFYGKDAHKRVVFAETNWPRPLRAAITSKYKLVYNLQANIYELYDLRTDPWEKKNIASRNSSGKKLMRGYLEDWLERVYYDRNTTTNQAASKRAKFLLKKKPRPKHTADLVYDSGRIELIGYDLDKPVYKPGDTLELTAYFEVNKRPTDDYMLQVEARLEKKAKLGKWVVRPARSRNRITGNGVFGSSRWRPGEYIKDEFTVRIPKNWAGGDTLVLGLRFIAKPRRKDHPKGKTHGGDANLGLLGTFPMPTPAQPPVPQRGSIKPRPGVPVPNPVPKGLPKPAIAPRTKPTIVPPKRAPAPSRK